MPLEDRSSDEARDEMGKRLVKAVMTNLLLVVLCTLYVLGGAWLFIELEYDTFEQQLLKKVETSKLIEQQTARLADELWFHKQQPDYDELSEMLIEEYHKNVTNAIKNASYPGKVVERSALTNAWSFPSALLFTLSIATTIGYGHVTPATDAGKMAVMGYAVVGIPLMLVFLANIGDAMASFFRNAYRNGCCRFCQRKRDREMTDYLREEEVRKMGKGKEKQGGRHRVGSVDIPDIDNMDSAWDDDHLQAPMDLDAVDAGTGSADDEQVPISLVLCIIAIYVLIGALLFGNWNDWSMIKGAYFSFVTLSTIGFGDLVPGWDNINTVEGIVDDDEGEEVLDEEMVKRAIAEADNADDTKQLADEF